MRKMRLSLDDLTVETFIPADALAPRGTVDAHQSGPVTNECASCGVYTCEHESGPFTDECVSCGVYTCAGAECGSEFLCTEYGVGTCEPYATCQGTTCMPPYCTNPGEGC